MQRERRQVVEQGEPRYSDDSAWAWEWNGCVADGKEE
jgi:hypothetical protein